MLIAVSKNKFIVLLIKIFGAVSLPIVARTRLQTFQTHSGWQSCGLLRMRFRAQMSPSTARVCLAGQSV